MAKNYWIDARSLHPIEEPDLRQFYFDAASPTCCEEWRKELGKHRSIKLCGGFGPDRTMPITFCQHCGRKL